MGGEGIPKVGETEYIVKERLEREEWMEREKEDGVREYAISSVDNFSQGNFFFNGVSLVIQAIFKGRPHA